MEKNKILTIATVSVIMIAIFSALFVLNSGAEKRIGGLYALDAQIISVDVGGITATPKMVESIEDIYEQVYGDYVREGFTIEDVMNDEAFWEEYCNYDPVITVNADGSYIVKISTQSGEKEIKLKSSVDSMLSMGTMYITTMYYYVCQKYGEEPYSESALNNEILKAEYQEVVAGGTDLAYIAGYTELIGYFDQTKYMDAGNHMIGEYDLETLAKNIKDIYNSGRSLILVATGRSIDDSAYNNISNTVKAHHGEEAIFITATDIKEAFANIECLGYILGYGDHVDDLIEDLQVRLYTVYYSMQQMESHKVYWENQYGRSVRSSGMSASIIDFFGWDTSLLNGSEIDTETLLKDRPDIIMYYTNDVRPMDEKMRA